MADSTRETVLKALSAILSTIDVDDYAREDPEPETVDSRGMVRLYDGDMGQPVEIVFSPTRYFWQHQAQVVVAVQLQDIDDRITRMDEILQSIQEKIDADRTLGGVCDHVETLPPEDDTEAVDGAPAIKRAYVGVVLHYNSTSALG